MKKKLNLKEKIQQFRAWRERPREVAPMSQEEHECLNCHDHYIGSYCPRCGQAANTSRFSMKVAAENFAEAYGMGERGMFRTILDLILRPGHLILDFLRGKRASYFAPFKLFFLLFALSVLVTHGLNVKGQALYDDDEEEIVFQEMDEDSMAGATAAMTETDVSERDNEPHRVVETSRSVVNKVLDKLERFEKRFPSINMLLVLMIVSGFLYLFFRRCPNIPDMRYSELFISLVYIANMYTVYSIVFDFFSLTKMASLSIFLTIIPLKQMSGYGWWRTILKTIVAFTIMFVLFIVFIVLAVLGVGLFVKYHG